MKKSRFLADPESTLQFTVFSEPSGGNTLSLYWALRGYNSSVKFEWGPRKAATNLGKHDVSFHEAVTIFDDPFAYTFVDPDHSEGERRFLTFGLSQSGRLVVVAYAERNDMLRLISARPATRKERRIYEEG